MTGARPSYHAGQFYPIDAGDVRESIAGFAADASPTAGACLGGMVPHAGWMFSGAVAYKLLARVAAQQPSRVVLLGAVHVPGVLRPAVGPWDRWEIPGATIEIDVTFQEQLRERHAAVRDDRAHAGEHSIEVQLPILAELLPGVTVVPIAVPSRETALQLGRALGEAVHADPATTCVVASSDLTHYGAEYYGFAPAGSGPEAIAWATANDRRFLDRVLALDAEGALREAREHRNACGAGAVAAAIECVKVLGATGAELLEHKSSLAVRDSGTGNFVGYAAVAFV